MKFKIIPNEQTPRIEEMVDLNKDYNLLCKFLKFASKRKNCVGLASNQVSLNSQRIQKRFFTIKDKHFWNILINPKILNYYGMGEQRIEECLTWIGKRINAMRWPSIQAEYYTLNGEYHKEKISGFYAQIFQHEYNHLEGIEEKIL